MKRAILLIHELALISQPVLALQPPQYRNEELLMFLVGVIAVGITGGVIIAQRLLSMTESEIEH